MLYFYKFQWTENQAIFLPPSSPVQNSHCAVSAIFVSKSLLFMREEHPCHLCWQTCNVTFKSFEPMVQIFNA